MRRLLVMSMAGVLLALGACQRSGEPETPAAPPSDAAPVASAPVGSVVLPSRTYQCGDLAVSATFDGVGAVDLSYAGVPLTLPQVESGSGARYADQQGNEFWSKGGQATLTLAGQEKRNCTPAAK
ncbi:MAG TPA: MliC family protein [Steroidobacteraceae bacterium]|nr:MliC family protein [Steroidobacteraceae bacterium]